MIGNKRFICKSGGKRPIVSIRLNCKHTGKKYRLDHQLRYNISTVVDNEVSPTAHAAQIILINTMTLICSRETKNAQFSAIFGDSWQLKWRFSNFPGFRKNQRAGGGGGGGGCQGGLGPSFYDRPS